MVCYGISGVANTNMPVFKTELQDGKREHEPFTTNSAKFSDERICCSASVVSCNL